MEKSKITFEFDFEKNDKYEKGICLVIKCIGDFSVDSLLKIGLFLGEDDFNPTHSNCFTFPIKRYTELIDLLLEDLKITQEFVIETMPLEIFKFVVMRWKRILETPHKSIEELLTDEYKKRIPARILNNAYEYQLRGIIKGIQCNGNILIGDDMGLGKTLQSLAIASYYFNKNYYRTKYKEEKKKYVSVIKKKYIEPDKQRKLLIVCPSSLTKNWFNECLKWNITRFREEIQIIRSDKDTIDWMTKRILIISYPLISIGKNKFKHSEFMENVELINTVILDESHALKSYKSKRSKALLLLCPKIKHKILISGTPQLARPNELYTQLRILLPNVIVDNYIKYTKRYCDGHESRFGWDDRGKSKMKELNAILQPIMIRRLKKDVLRQLPPKKRRIINLETSDETKRQFDILKEKMKALRNEINRPNISKKEAHRGLMNMNVAKMEMWRETSQLKVPAVNGWLYKFIKDNLNKKCIIFAHHGILLDSIEEMVKDKFKGTKYIRIDGKTSTKKRQNLVDKIADPDSDYMLAILSITACCTGLNFTPGVSTVIFAEMYWTPSIMIQAEDRAHRIGATADYIDCYYLKAENTVDDDVYRKLQNKFKINNEIIDANTNRAGYSVDEVSSFAFTGNDNLDKFGIQQHVNAIKIDVEENETLEQYLKRAAIKIESNYIKNYSLVEYGVNVENDYHETNKLNISESKKYINLSEMEGDTAYQIDHNEYCYVLTDLNEASVAIANKMASGSLMAQFLIGRNQINNIKTPKVKIVFCKYKKPNKKRKREAQTLNGVVKLDKWFS